MRGTIKYGATIGWQYGILSLLIVICTHRHNHWGLFHLVHIYHSDKWHLLKLSREIQSIQGFSWPSTSVGNRAFFLPVPFETEKVASMLYLWYDLFNQVSLFTCTPWELNKQSIWKALLQWQTSPHLLMFFGHWNKFGHQRNHIS